MRSRRAGRRPRGAGRGRKLRSRLLIAVAVVLVAAVAWVAVRLLRPVPSMALTASVTTARVLPGVAPRADWPGRAEAAVGLPGVGLVRGTRYADASGADPATVSTVGDQFRLTLRALQVAAFRQIVAMPQVTPPVAGVAYNVNAGLGHDGIVGVKTGSSSRAGGCLALLPSG